MKNPKTPARLPRKAPSNQTGGTAWGKKMAAEFSRMMQSADMKKLILLNFPYIIAFYMVEKAAWLYRHCNGDSVVDRLMVLFMNFGLAYKSVLPSFHPFDLMVGLVGAAALKAVIYFKGKNAKKYRQGEEYGSARWGNQKDIEPFIDPVFENNVILTQTERLMMSGRPKHPKYARNKNVIVIGGSGSGKTRFYVKPNLMQMPQKVSYVLTDPKGTIIVECGKMLSDAGYALELEHLEEEKLAAAIQQGAGRKVIEAVRAEKSVQMKSVLAELNMEQFRRVPLYESYMADEITKEQYCAELLDYEEAHRKLNEQLTAIMEDTLVWERALSLRNPWIQQMAQYKTPEELDRNFVKKYIEQVTVTLLDDGQVEISLTMKTDEWKQMLSRIEVEGTDSGTKE